MKRGVRKARGRFNTNTERFNVRKTIPFKILIICVVVLLILLVVWIGLKVSEKVEEKKLEGELGTYGIFGVDEISGIFFPDNCSDASLIAVWESVFRENSSSVTIISDKNANETCSKYLIYKTLENNITYIVYSSITDLSYSDYHQIYGIYANLTENSLDYLGGVEGEDLSLSQFTGFISDLRAGRIIQGKRNITNITEANNEFSNIFKVSNGSWMYDSSNQRYYFYGVTSGYVYQNITLNHIYYGLEIDKPIDLTQIKDFENITLYKGSSYYWHLDDYFINLGYPGHGLDTQAYLNLPSDVEYSFGYNVWNHEFYFYGDFTFTEEILINFTLNNTDYGVINSNNFYIKIIEPDYPEIPKNCSNESLKSSWEDVFKESSDNLTILTNSSCVNAANACPSYLLYNANETVLYFLAGTYENHTFDTKNSIVGVYLSSSPDKINAFVSNYSDSIDCINFMDSLGNSFEDLSFSLENRQTIIENEKGAIEEFSRIFNINSFFTYYYHGNEDYYGGEYYHGDSYSDQRIDFLVYGEKVLDYFYFANTSYVEVNFTKIKDIENITIYKNENLTNAIDLKNYVAYPGGASISFLGEIFYVNPNLTENRYISFYPDTNWYNQSELSVRFHAGIDYYYTNRFYVTVLNETRPVSNHFPSFNDTACGDLEWEVDAHYHLDMEDCWYDLDGDSLSGYKYGNSSGHNRNLTITKSSNQLTLTPNSGWVGTGYFFVNASDGKNESQGRVDFEVVDSSDDGDGDGNGDGGDDDGGTPSSGNNTNATAKTPNITSSSPPGTEVFIFPGNKTFSITARNYVSIKWYLNGTLVHEGGLSYEFSSLKEGDIVKVEVINGTKIDSKTWNIKIQEDEEGEEPVFDVGSVVFYSIIAIIGIIILLIVWLFIIEKNKGSRQTKMGFGVSGSESDVKITGERGSSLDYFNIPE